MIDITEAKRELDEGDSSHSETPNKSDSDDMNTEDLSEFQEVAISEAMATLEDTETHLQEEEVAMSFKPDDMPQLMPYLVVTDPEAAMSFYEKTFGFQRAGEPLVQNDQIIHCEMTFMDTRIMIGLEGCWGNSARCPASSGVDQGIGLYVYCPDVDSHHADAAASGAEITMEPDDMFWGDRMYSAKDMDGYRWSFATKVGEFDPSKLPEDMQ